MSHHPPHLLQPVSASMIVIPDVRMQVLSALERIEPRLEAVKDLEAKMKGLGPQVCVGCLLGPR